MAQLFESPHYLAVEGPFGAGKSILADMLAEEIGGRRIAATQGNPFLSRFHRGDKAAALPAQTWFLMSRYEQLCGAGEHDAKSRQSAPIVADYIFQRDKLFACLNLNDDELALYNRQYEYFRDRLPAPNLVIYLQASPQVLRQRLRRQNIARERRISDRYLERIVQAYEHFFFHYTTSDLLIVNTDKLDFMENNGDLRALLRRLTQPVRGKQYFLPLGDRSGGVHRKVLQAGRSAIAAAMLCVPKENRHLHFGVL